MVNTKRNVFIGYIAVQLAAYYTWLYFLSRNEDLTTLGANVLSAAAPLVAAISLLGTYRSRGSGSGSSFWLLLSLGNFSFFAAEAIWLYYENGLGVEVPFPGWADLFYLLQIGFYLVAFFGKFYDEIKTFKAVRLLFDTLIVMTVATAFSWYFFIRQLIQDSGEPPFATAVLLSYPVGDLGLVFALVGSLFVTSRIFDQKTLLLLLAGLSVQIVADSAFLYLSVVNDYESGSWVDPLWTVATLLVALAGRCESDRRRDPGTGTEAERSRPEYRSLKPIRIALPYVGVLLLFIVMIRNHNRVDSITIGSIVSLSLIIVRQVITLLENDKLLQSLQGMTERLGELVDKQTEELLEKNRQLQQAMQRMRFMAYHDELTELPNRRMFEEKLAETLARTDGGAEKTAVLFLDLDRFKKINDHMGHHVGDRLLKACAAKFRSCLDESATLCRLSGDEFAMLLPRVNDTADIERFVDRLRVMLEEPVTLNNHDMHVTFSLGIAVSPEDGKTVEQLMQHADHALFVAKEAGRNKSQFFTPDMFTELERTAYLENELFKAIERGQLALLYQPQLDVLSGRLRGVEALIRWHHPELGTISPVEFIPIAEETGLIVPIGEWVIRTACLQHKRWLEQGFPHLRIGINLSPSHFMQERLVDNIRAILQETDMDPGFLDLEITESVTMHGTDEVVQKLFDLKTLGVSVSIDDFGTGYSSLSYLQNFPLDTLKIDKSFVSHIDDGMNGGVIVKTIVAMAHSLKLNVIAEGVETEEQLRFLRQLGCNEIQGYYISKPVPAEEATRLLVQWNGAATP